MNPIQRISIYYATLSNAEMETCNLIMDSPDIIVDNSIAEAAKHFKVSTSSILRFTKKIGYKGYTDFKYALESYLQEATVKSKKSKIAYSVIDAYKSTLNELEKTFDEAPTKKLVNLMKNKERIITMGIGNSQLPASQLAYSFYNKDKWIDVISDTVKINFISDNLISLDDYLIIIFSVSGGSDTYSATAKKLKKKGATVALITANTDEELYDIDVMINLPSLPFDFHNEHSSYSSYENRSLFYIYIDILIGYYFAK